MSFWTFLTDEDGWTLSGNAAWDGANGHGPGCISGVTAMSASIAFSLTPGAGAPWSYWLRIVAEEGADLGEVPYQIIASGAGGFSNGTTLEITEAPYDSGWFKVQGTCENEGEITGIQIGVDDNNLSGITAYFDSVYFGEAEPGGYELTHSAGGMPGAVMV